MDVLTPEQRRRCMQGNKSSGTKPELALGRLLWRNGIHYRKQPKNVPGKPDFCIKKYRLAIFVDGEFWHGRNWEQKRESLKGNRDFWIAKIERNIQRDLRVTQALRTAGWKVFRFWESDIKKHPGVCLGMILRYMSQFAGVVEPDYVPMDDYMCDSRYDNEAWCDDLSVAADVTAGYGDEYTDKQ